MALAEASCIALPAGMLRNDQLDAQKGFLFLFPSLFVAASEVVHA